MLKFKTSCAVLAYLSSSLLNEVGLSLFRYFEVGLRVCDIVVKKFTTAISSPDEFLYIFLIVEERRRIGILCSGVTRKLVKFEFCPLLILGALWMGQHFLIFFLLGAIYDVETLCEMSVKTYPFHNSFLLWFHFFLPDCGPFFSELLGFCFQFFLIFVSVSCAILSWPQRQLLSARKYTVIPYRIV